MAEAEFPLGPEIGIDQGTDFVPTPEREGPGLLKTLAPIAGGLALGGIPGLLLAAFGGAGAIGSSQARGRENAFTQLSNQAELSPEEALQEPRILEAFASQMMTDPATAQQGQVFFQRAQQIRTQRTGELERVRTGEADLRGELEGTFAFDELARTGEQYRIALSLFEENTPTATTQLARVLEKTIDPTGVVRPSDFELILQGVGASDRIMDAFRRFQEGGDIPPSLRPDLMRTIALVAQSRRAAFNESTVPRFRDLALGNGLRPSQVFFDPLEGLGIDEFLTNTPKSITPEAPGAAGFGLGDLFGGAPPTVGGQR